MKPLECWIPKYSLSAQWATDFNTEKTVTSLFKIAFLFLAWWSICLRCGIQVLPSHTGTELGQMTYYDRQGNNRGELAQWDLSCFAIFWVPMTVTFMSQDKLTGQWDVCSQSTVHCEPVSCHVGEVPSQHRPEEPARQSTKPRKIDTV